MNKLKQLLLSILITGGAFSQKEGDVSFISKNRDTLFLVDDNLGYIIKNIWETEPKTGDKPTIIFKSLVCIENKNKLKIKEDEFIK
jgi:hypothetical protein